MVTIFCGICIFSVLACQSRQKSNLSSPNKTSNSISELEMKVDRLEKVVKQNINLNTNEKTEKIPAGKIKSLTFRIGTEDDRLRIYWEDGSKSDLPCTKEQVIWACG